MRLSDLLRLLVLAAIWGASFLFMRVAAPVIGSMPTAFFRALIASAGLLALLMLMRASFDFRGKLGRCMMLGVINAGLPSAMYSLAALALPAGYSAIFNATTPLMGVLIGALFFQEGVTRSKLIGVALGLFGVAVLTRTGPVAFDWSLLLGAGACLVATTCYGFAGFLARRWLGGPEGLDNRLSALASLLGASVFLLPMFAGSLWLAPPPTWGDTTVWLSMLALGLVCTAFAYVLYFRLLDDIGPIKASTTTFLIPPFGILWGALLLGEPLSWNYLPGGVLIALALWLVVRRPATP